MESITTRTGLQLPKVGLGTWRMLGDDCTRLVEQALDLGYRHIDTATAYDNEAAVGKALAQTAIPREQIHVTTKVWHDQLAPQAMRQSLDASRKALGDDCLDLFLIHWPGNAAAGWSLERSVETLVALRDEGKARQIGVANFNVALLQRAVVELGAPLAVVQVEYHVLLNQQPVLDFARQHGMALTAYTPLARGQGADTETVQRIAKKHGVLPSQIALGWVLEQDGVAAIPKSNSLVNQQANLEALKVKLDDEDRAAIAALRKDVRIVNPAFAPAWD
ncbi:aldo/keto reductase [Pseudomonas sp. GV071]|uniref:aldo/keto reductase n=1 Tax=Pseudomonas sp. GV071 TaxID=2135754 RepID=UPI000D3A8873|nr:aldo/keto reductase [Pseudomonas sp. GV071]PTQ68636.1 2,5-diketo-D-gluconate reductase B [Pseudomonas sp. GV071]